MLPHDRFRMEEGGRRCRHLGDDEEDDNRPDRYPGLILHYQRSVSAMASSMASSMSSSQ